MLQQIQQASEFIRNGGVILIPAETCWGLCCDPRSEQALDKAFSILQDVPFREFIISEISQLRNVVLKIPDLAWDLMEFAENPMTVLFSDHNNVPDRLQEDEGRVAVRLLNEEPAKSLVNKVGRPLIFFPLIQNGRELGSRNDISADITSRVDHIVESKAGEAIGLKPSTVLRLGLHGEIKFLKKPVRP